MPRDLFGTVASPPPPVRSRRSSLVSIVVHSLAVAAALLFSLFDSNTLPMPHEALAYFEAAMPIAEVTLPSPPVAPRRDHPLDPALPTIARDSAPVVAPQGITSENGIEAAVSAQHRVGDGGLAGPAGTPIGVVRLDEPPPPPPPPPPTDRPIRLHSGIKAPLNVNHVAPIYPVIAQRARVEGTVILEATIDTQGTVVSAKVLRSIPLLDAAALEAVGQWRFTPALLNGVAVPVIMTVTVRFTLR